MKNYFNYKFIQFLIVRSISLHALKSLSFTVDPDGPVVIILTSGSEVRGFKPSRGRWIFSKRKNPEYDFLTITTDLTEVCN